MTGKIFLTGGTGMVGRNLKAHPAAADWEILSPSSQELDLMNGVAVVDYIEAHQPDLVIHCAGKVGGIGANTTEPVAFLEQNVSIGRNVIMASYRAGVKRLINLASTCIYPRNFSSPLSEDMILRGELEPTNEGYAIAKIVALRLCQYIRNEDKRKLYKTLIPCNIYGPYDKFDPEVAHLIPAIITKVHEAKVTGAANVEIWGDGSARREFMYSTDLADAIYRAADTLEELPDLMNIGLGVDHTIKEYYEIVAGVVGWDGSFTHNLAKPVGMIRKLSDNSRQNAWGWRPATSLEAGISNTYDFYLENMNK